MSAGADPTAAGPASAPAGTPLVELRDVGKRYGAIIALRGVSATVRAGEVTCVLGDNGAGKSTFIKIIAGAHEHSEGELLIDGEPTRLASPRAALDAGIATVYQDLAVVDLMPIWRNFFLGRELRRGGFLDIRTMRRVTREAMAGMGIDVRDVDQPVGTMSGGERQCVAIARAVHFGARVLILDEPTAALGVKQSGVVLRHVATARDRGLGVVLVTHNPHHAWLVGDRFVVLKRGVAVADEEKSALTLHELTGLMSGGAELDELRHELTGD